MSTTVSQQSWRDWLLTDTPASRRQAAWGGRYRLWRDFTGNTLAMAGLIVIVLMALAALFAPLLAPYDPGAQETDDKQRKIGQVESVKQAAIETFEMFQ